MNKPDIKKLFSAKGVFSGKRVLTVTIVATMLLGTTLTVYAASGSSFPVGGSTYTTQSEGRVEYKQEGETEPSVIIDSEDIKQLATGLNECHEEVTNLYSSLNDAFGEGTFPGDGSITIEDIINGKKKDVTVRPDGTTDGTTMVNTLLPAITSTLTVDSSIPEGTTYTDTNSNVVECASATADNLSRGVAAWVDGALIIGTGADNDTYYEEGTRCAELNIYSDSMSVNGGNKKFDISSLPNYESFELWRNIFIRVNNFYSHHTGASWSVSYSYDPTTGIVTVKCGDTNGIGYVNNKIYLYVIY